LNHNSNPHLLPLYEYCIFTKRHMLKYDKLLEFMESILHASAACTSGHKDKRNKFLLNLISGVRILGNEKVWFASNPKCNLLNK
jgi:hypothetical protein